MDCKEVEARLTPFLDRELNPAELIRVRQHLEDCPPCEGQFHLELEVKRLVRRECQGDDAPARLRNWVRQLADQARKQE
jgi:mycothiol system anti-sigma-R factor